MLSKNSSTFFSLSRRSVSRKKMTTPSFGVFVSGTHKPSCRCPGCRAKARSAPSITPTPSSSTSTPVCRWCDGHSSGPSIRGHEVQPVTTYTAPFRPRTLADDAVMPGVNLPGRQSLPSQCVQRPVTRTKCKNGTCSVTVSRAVTCYDFATGESATVETEPEYVWTVPSASQSIDVSRRDNDVDVPHSLIVRASSTFGPSAYPVDGPAAPLYYLHNPVPLETGSIDDGSDSGYYGASSDYYGMVAPAPSPVRSSPVKSSLVRSSSIKSAI